MLGGTTIVGADGLIIWVDRPHGGDRTKYIGQSNWAFSAPSDLPQVQSHFAWTLAMGARTAGICKSGGTVGEHLFRYAFDRLNVHQPVILCQFAPYVEARLTAAEEQVAALLVLDYRSEEIAAALSISPNTVQTHRRNVLHKVGVRGVAGLARWWEERERWKHG